jgi:hypothetical protein
MLAFLSMDDVAMGDVAFAFSSPRLHDLPLN